MMKVKRRLLGFRPLRIQIKKQSTKKSG